MTIKLIIKKKFEVTSATREDNYKRDNEVNVSLIIRFLVKDLLSNFVDNEINFNILTLVLIIIFIIFFNDEVFFRFIVMISSLRSIFDVKRSKRLTLISILISILILILILRLILIFKRLRIERAFDVISYLFLIYKERHYDLCV